MASTLPSPELSGGATSPVAITTKSQRVLACILCQQRKVKCDRRFPCSNCTKAGAQCVPAALVPRQRRRRFPEKELLERLRHYENLLKEHHIAFEPLHGKSSINAPSSSSGGLVSSPVHEQFRDHALPHEEDQQIAVGPTEFKPKNFWHAMNQRSQESDNDDSNDSDPEAGNEASSYVLREKVIKQAWGEMFLDSDHLLFCARNTTIQLESLHPTQAQIFRLWQIYLDRVNPLLKITHTPTLQARIIDAASNITEISPAFEALMFSIYCMAVYSLGQDECHSLFGTPRHDVLRGYQLGAREAMLNCNFLKTNDIDCLIALHLYQMTIKPDVDPRAQASMLGVVLRIAQRMGIHMESVNTKYNILEAEMRRRLWWSIILYDARLSEMADLRLSNLLPVWDCKKPLNVNDFDLRPEMKQLPTVFSQPSEALFPVLRSEIGDFTRHDPGHLDFVNPVYKFLTRKPTVSVSDVEDLDALESMIENKYLKNCDLENPLHYMTVWTTRVAIAKTRFIRYLATSPRMNAAERDAHRNTGVAIARSMLQCDAELMLSPLTVQFRWHIFLHFPFPAYVHIVQDLKERPLGDHADKGWVAMTQNSAARLHHMDNKNNPMDRKNNPFYKIFAGLVLQAWSAREAALGYAEETPGIVNTIRTRVAAMQAHVADGEKHSPEPLDFGTFDGLYDLGAMHHNMVPSPGSFGMVPMGMNSSPWAWQGPTWNPITGHGW